MSITLPMLKIGLQIGMEKLLMASQENILRESVNIFKKIKRIILERNITIAVASVLDTNTSSIEEGEQSLSLIQYGETFVIIKGAYSESSLHSLESLTQLGTTFKN